MVPILLVLAFRLNTKFENWENHNWWGGLIAALMAAMVFSISISEMLFFPLWTGMGYYSILVLLWIIYGQLCAEQGLLGGVSPRMGAFLYGSFCGVWAAVQTYREAPQKLALSVSGAFMSRIGIPILLFVPNMYSFIPFAILTGGVLLLFKRTDEQANPFNKTLWVMAVCTWSLSWYSPLFGLSAGTVIGLVQARSLQGWRNVLSFGLFGVFISSLLAGVGLLELCTRYMEGGVLGEQVGLSFDILILGFVLALLSDPIVSALSVQGMWDRALDVQHLSSVHGLYISTALGQVLFAFYAAGCIRKGKWLWLFMMTIGVGYMMIWEALL